MPTAPLFGRDLKKCMELKWVYLHCCYDNACVESFFHSLKVECLHGEHFVSREIMRATVFNYIECDYSRWRRHSWCGGLTPEQFENQNLA
ncbi:TPA: IS3 family transposase [Klebsiella aerogenes]